MTIIIIKFYLFHCFIIVFVALRIYNKEDSETELQDEIEVENDNDIIVNEEFLWSHDL